MCSSSRAKNARNSWRIFVGRGNANVPMTPRWTSGADDHPAIPDTQGDPRIHTMTTQAGIRAPTSHLTPNVHATQASVAY
jgi:hypothetical protein